MKEGEVIAFVLSILYLLNILYVHDYSERRGDKQNINTYMYILFIYKYYIIFL